MPVRFTKKRRPAPAGRRHNSVATLLALVTENEPLGKIIALFVASHSHSLVRQSIGSVATREVVAVEIVRALVGSIGLVASVPISTALAAKVLQRKEACEHQWQK